MESPLQIDGVEFTPDNTGVGLYYGVYKYSLLVPFPCVHIIRYIKTSRQFNVFLDSQWRSWWEWDYTAPGGEKTNREKIKRRGGSINLLRRFIKWRSDNPAKGVRLALLQDKVALYFNDPAYATDFLTKFKPKSYFKDELIARYKVVEREYERGVIYHVNPKHKIRLFFNTRLISEDQADKFIESISGPEFSISTSLFSRIKAYNKAKAVPGMLTGELFIYRIHFIDMDDERLATVLALRWPDLINKVCRIERR